jgi:hypothetical protein
LTFDKPKSHHTATASVDTVHYVPLDNIAKVIKVVAQQPTAHATAEATLGGKNMLQKDHQQTGERVIGRYYARSVHVGEEASWSQVL